MAWVRLDDGFTDHPKVVAAGPLAGWLYVCGLTYCNRFLTDGFIPERQVKRLADLDDGDVHASALVGAGLWERVDGGYQVHDYHDYQPTRKKVEDDRAAARERMANRRGGSAEVQASFEETDDDVRENFVETPAEVLLPQTRPKPVPVPTPNPDPSGERARAKRSRPLPDDFEPPGGWAEVELSMTASEVDLETQKFRDHFRANGKVMKDWEAAWRNWMRRSQTDFAPRGSPAGSVPIRPPTNTARAKADVDYLMAQIEQDEQHESSGNEETRRDYPNGLATLAGGRH